MICRYVRPEFVGEDEEPQLVITAGRHPVLDAIMDEPVVPNDTCLRGGAGPRAAIITGPNMGGKSCYIRQAALMALMAQVLPVDIQALCCPSVRTSVHCSSDASTGSGQPYSSHAVP